MYPGNGAVKLVLPRHAATCEAERVRTKWTTLIMRARQITKDQGDCLKYLPWSFGINAADSAFQCEIGSDDICT